MKKRSILRNYHLFKVGIRTYSESYASKIVTRLLKEYANVDRKLFYRNARALGMTKQEQAHYLQGLKIQHQQTVQREQLIKDVLLRSTPRIGELGSDGRMRSDVVRQLLAEADYYAMEWLPSTPRGMDEYRPITMYDTQHRTKKQLLNRVIDLISTDRWESRLEEYKSRYLLALKQEFADREELYVELKKIIDGMTWEEWLIFSTRKEGRIGYRYELAHRYEALRRLNVRGDIEGSPEAYDKLVAQLNEIKGGLRE